MSGYDLNHNNHVNRNNYPNLGNLHPSSNGTLPTQQVRYQVDNEHYMNRSSQNPDMSVQLTRPTSKTAMLVRQRRAMLEQMSCSMCKGYLIDATTIDECMDSFCRSCIVTHLRNNNNCPKCGVILHKTNPMSTIRPDKVLQDIVYKLVPGLYDDEMKRRRDFYRGTFASSSSSDEDDESGSSSNSSTFNGRTPMMNNETYGVVPHPKPYYKPTDNIDLSIEPQTRGESSAIYYDNKRKSIVTCFTGNLQHQYGSGSLFSAVDSQQFKTYLRCPAKLTALQLKKFIAAKFNVCKDDTIHLLYLNESVKDEYSLIDIAYIYDWRGMEHMKLFYIIERDLSKMDPQSASDCFESQETSRKTKPRQMNSVGTSTQTYKRVCIDPHPKFYEEKEDDHSATSSSASGRSMRSKTSELSSNMAVKVVSVSNQMPQAPILRSYSSTMGRDNGRNSGTSKQASNGVSSRELSALRNNDSSGAKETRLTRQSAADSTARSSPRVNVKHNKNNDYDDDDDDDDDEDEDEDDDDNDGARQRNVTTYSRIKLDNDRQPDVEAISANSITTRQMVPHQPYQSVPRGYSTISSTNAASSSSTSNIQQQHHSSLVTLANFTDARNNHVVTMSGTPATISSSYNNMLTAASVSRLDAKSDVRGVNHGLITNSANNKQPSASQSTPQLAFSFVTERGITIVRRLNNGDTATTASGTMSTSSAATTKSGSLPTHPMRVNSASFATSTGGTNYARGATSQSTTTSTPTYASSSSTATSTIHINHQHNPHKINQTSSLSRGTVSVQDDANSASNNNINSINNNRHLTKVKPVYKTFVDPTKLKSPNFKKLGYTVRH